MISNEILGYLFSAATAIAVTVFTQHSIRRNNENTKREAAAKESSAAGVDLTRIESEAYLRAERSNKVALEEALSYSKRLEARILELEKRADTAESRADASARALRKAEEHAVRAEYIAQSLRTELIRAGAVVPPHLNGD